MMDDQLDNDLKNRVKEVFDNFDDTSADEGWLQLRKKFPELQANRRAFAWLWWGSAAAILFLFLGIGLWVFNNDNSHAHQFAGNHHTTKHPQPQNLADNRRDHKSIAGDTVRSSLTPANGTTAQTATGGLTAAQSSPVAVHKGAHTAAPLTAAEIGKPATDITFIAKSNSAKPLPVTVNNERQVSNGGQPVIASRAFNGDTAAKGIFIAKLKTDSVRSKAGYSNVQQLAANGNADTSVKTKSVIIATKPAAKSISSMFAEDNGKKRITGKADDTKKVRFGVYATTYFNYAKGSNNQVNAGAGFSSDIRISGKLRLVTGVSVGQNTLNYTGGPPPVDQSGIYAAAIPKRSTAASVLAIPEPTFKSYDASLVGLDIPLNLKYEFNPQRSDTYIMAGLSSGTFINESYTYQYNYSSFFNPVTQQTQDQTSSKNFSNFYFAKTLNVAFGVGYPIGKNHLVIEPFLKYPLQGLGSQDIRFGAGGLNLKFNFQTSKK